MGKKQTDEENLEPKSSWEDNALLNFIGENPVKAIWILIAGIFVLCLLFSGSGSSSSSRTDGVFESAVDKIDSGRADQLNARERQRIDDIVNWCNRCGKPYRSCGH